MYDLPVDPYARPRKNEIDEPAVTSPLNRIPGLDAVVVRELIDLGITRVHHLVGRSPEVLFAEILKKKPKTPRERLWQLRLAVYYAETPQPDPAKLKKWAWRD